MKSYIVQHTHWDREWYFTVEDAKVLSDQVFTEAIEELVQNPKVNFTLDGQTSIVDEYLELNPDKLKDIKSLMKEKRLFVGPWYAQTDALLVDAESILRNLMIGIRDTKQKYGEPMMVGYLPDTFGFNAQMPTLLNQVGIDNFIAWRGIDFKENAPSPYFIWKGLGDKSVYSAYFPHGYMTGLMTLDAIRDIPKFVSDKLDPAIKFLQEHSGQNNVLIPSGIDQKNMVLSFDEIITEINKESKYNNVISDYGEFIEILRKSEGLPEYQGDLRLPVYSRVHRTISSVRTRMKIENYMLEQRIIRTIEPLYVIAKSLDIYISDGILDRLWKKVLENQAHDSIGGCVSDNVAEDIFHRIKEANEIAEGIENLILKRISERLDLKDNEVLIVNCDPIYFKGKKKVKIVNTSKNIIFPNNEAVIINEKYYPKRNNIMTLTSTGYDYIEEPGYYELDLLVDVVIPPLGYVVITYSEHETELENSETCKKNEISNEDYTVSYIDGEISVKYKDIYSVDDAVVLWDQGNDGDTYDFSPLDGDKEIRLPFSECYVTSNSFSKTLHVVGESTLPYTLEDRENGDVDTDVKYTVSLTLNDSGRIEGSVEFDNQILSHRLRLSIKTMDASGSSIAQIQNGFIKNKNKTINKNWKDYRVEKPVNIEIFDKSVSVEDNIGFLTVFADGLKEYERIEDNLFITLQSTTGELGKPNLAWRPGRASGDTTSEGHVMMSTPLAQEIGIQKYSFALEYSEGYFNEYEVAYKVYTRLHRSLSYQNQKLNKFVYRLDNKIWPYQNTKKDLKKEYSALEVPEGLIVSAIHKSYYDDSVVIRFANPSAKKIDISQDFLDQVDIINAIEKPIETNNHIEPYDYLTVRINKI